MLIKSFTYRTGWHERISLHLQSGRVQRKWAVFVSWRRRKTWPVKSFFQQGPDGVSVPTWAPSWKYGCLIVKTFRDGCSRSSTGRGLSIGGDPARLSSSDCLRRYVRWPLTPITPWQTRLGVGPQSIIWKWRLSRTVVTKQHGYKEQLL